MAQLRKEKYQIAAMMIKQEASPAPQAAPSHSCPEGLLTPPASNRKFIGSVGPFVPADLSNLGRRPQTQTEQDIDVNTTHRQQQQQQQKMLEQHLINN